MPRVSVIIPNYNHERFLKQRIESVLNQSYQDFELIILDDCSTDNSRQVIEQFQHHNKVAHIVYNGKNSGSPFKQWQVGTSLASGDWIWIAESDDYAGPDFLKALLGLTESFENVGIAYSNSYKVDVEGKVDALPEYMKSPFIDGVTEVRERLCHYNTITNASSCIINKKIAAGAICNLAKYRACGDWIFYTRVLQQSNLAYSPLKLNYYRWHPKSISFTASKSKAYIIEGVDVINNINFKKVKFSFREFFSLCKGWLNKAGEVGFKHRLRPVFIVTIAVVKFCIAKVTS